MFFFFNDTATTEIYTLSLHDALPISWLRCSAAHPAGLGRAVADPAGFAVPSSVPAGTPGLDRQREGRIRQQAQSEVLPPDCGGPPSTPLPNPENEPYHHPHPPPSPPHSRRNVKPPPP